MDFFGLVFLLYLLKLSAGYGLCQIPVPFSWASWGGIKKTGRVPYLLRIRAKFVAKDSSHWIFGNFPPDL